MAAFIGFLHLLSIVAWIGTIIFFSFFAAPSIFRMLPREKAGEVIGDIFPKYWAVGYVSSVVSLLSLILLAPTYGFAYFRFLVLLVMTVISFYSGLVVGREARSIKAEIRAADSDSAKVRLRGAFARVHKLSAILNMTVLALGLFYIFLLSLRLAG